MSAGGLRGATVALQHREFRIFWIAAFVSNTGGWMQSAGLPYVAYQLTGTNGGVGATGFMQYVPVLIAGAVGGWLADSFDLRKLLILTQLAQACIAFALWVLVAQGWATPTSLAAVAFLGGLASGLNIPVWQSFVGKLVPRSI
ncbi:MAG TPA: MFS transporter, partial [Microthrixaceae bacterium]|nr:MFS transporter [Microthrixaceae bacterium]